MSIKRKVFNLAVRFLKKVIRGLCRDKATSISARLAEELSPTLTRETDFGTISFFCPGKLPEWRARTLFTEEPETIEWINSFSDTDILWDIGANVGVYSLYAALKGLTVISFEPSPSNYYLLSRNIEINKMDDRIFALCIALNDVTKLGSFYMANTELGGALNSFGEAIDWQGKPFVASLKQAMIGFSVDSFIEQFGPPFPNHVKIDVDGIESKIIRGAKKTLGDKRVKSVLVELDIERRDYCRDVIEIMEASGLEFQNEQRAPEFEWGKFSQYSHVFVRPHADVKKG